MREKLVALAALVVLGALNYAILAKERILEHGELVYLELAPVDPRSLMQGDYMRLRYEVERQSSAQAKEAARRRGDLVVRLAEDGVGRFVRIDDGSSLARGERRIRYHQRRGRVRVVPDAFFFQEGHAEHYEGARYGVFRFEGPDHRVLVGLADETKRLLEPPSPQ